MGREIRMVPPNWEHPKNDRGTYMPMYDEDFDNAMSKWISEYNQWKDGKHPSQTEYPEDTKGLEYWEWESGPPDPDCYRPKFKEPATWFQVYETVSEGTPLTLPFETKQELVDYLVNVGAEWDGKWSREAAESFVKHEWAPSGLMTGGKFYTSKEIIL